MTRGNAGLYETFWGSTAPANSDSANATLIAYAMRFQLTAAGSVFGMRYARNKATFGAVIGVLWDPVSGAAMRSCVFRTKAASGVGFDRWETAYFHPKYKVIANQQVIIAVSFASARQMFTNVGLVAASITHGHITALKDGLSAHANGTTENDTVKFPVTSNGGDLMGVDLVFGPQM
jgi:hypothetical protein